MSADHSAYARHIAGIHRELGIKPDYATQRGLTLQPEADLLVNAGRDAEGRELQLASAAAAAWQQMSSAASEDGIELRVVSGFRSVARQAEIIRTKLARGENLTAILSVNAAPGYSEHHTGRALDLGMPGEPPLEESFSDTSAFRWLQTHAAHFGFYLSYPKGNPHGIAFEPWHWYWLSEHHG